MTQEHAGQLNQHGEILMELKADFGIQKALIQAVHEVPNAAGGPSDRPGPPRPR